MFIFLLVEAGLRAAEFKWGTDVPQLSLIQTRKVQNQSVWPQFMTGAVVANLKLRRFIAPLIVVLGTARDHGCAETHPPLASFFSVTEVATGSQ